MYVLKSNTPFLLQEMWGSLGRAVAPAELQVNGAHGWVQGICWALALALVQSPHSPGERRLLGLAVEKAGQPAGCWQADPKLCVGEVGRVQNLPSLPSCFLAGHLAERLAGVPEHITQVPPPLCFCLFLVIVVERLS